jgi:hypothetical protein
MLSWYDHLNRLLLLLLKLEGITKMYQEISELQRRHIF